MEEIHIVTVSNDKYAKPLAVMLTSLLHNLRGDYSPVIYTIYTELSEENQTKLKKVAGKYNASIKFLSGDAKLYNKFMTKWHLTKETYYRFSIPDLISKKVDKVIYLDSDIIVAGDISKLWRKDISKYALAAVENPGLKYRFKALSIPEDGKYFNAGVLLINLKRWREENISGKILEFIRKYPWKISFCSQDPMNAILHSDWKQLNPKWNFQVFRYQHLQIKPAIIHFSTDKKPWKDRPPHSEQYDQYERMTEW